MFKAKHGGLMLVAVLLGSSMEALAADPGDTSIGCHINRIAKPSSHSAGRAFKPIDLSQLSTYDSVHPFVVGGTIDDLTFDLKVFVVDYRHELPNFLYETVAELTVKDQVTGVSTVTEERFPHLRQTDESGQPVVEVEEKLADASRLITQTFRLPSGRSSTRFGQPITAEGYQFYCSLETAESETESTPSP